jgi:hypothetical protein
LERFNTKAGQRSVEAVDPKKNGDGHTTPESVPFIREGGPEMQALIVNGFQKTTHTIDREEGK